jgi:hypothetical protein
MPPKSTFTIPMGDAVWVVTEPRRSKWGVQTMEKDVIPKLLNTKKSSKDLGSLQKADSPTEGIYAQSSKNQSLETHTLQAMEPHEDGGNMELQSDERQPESNVCTTTLPFIVVTLMIVRHQWTNG